jgi:hypothetical protein
MEHFVKMTSLPPGLTFPPDLSDRIRFEAASQRLVFRGFMSKAEFDRLCRLSDDWGYRRPLEDLFRLSTSKESERPLLARLSAVFSGLGF